MKLYVIGSPGGKPVEMKLDTEEGPVEFLELGEKGRGRSRKIIPIVGTGSEIRAKKTEDGVVLVRGDWDPEDRSLVVVNAVGAYDRYRSYGILNARGISTIASGMIAFGQAGRTNSGEESLIIAETGAEFKLNSKYASHWYRWDGKEWIQETPEERKARLALAEIEQGGGEWL